MFKIGIALSIVFCVITFVIVVISLRKMNKENSFEFEDIKFILPFLGICELVAMLTGLFWFVVFPIVIVVGGTILFIYWDTFKQKWKEFKEIKNDRN